MSTCKDCGWWIKICKCKSTEAYFNTSKDRLWNFTDTSLTGKPIEVNSKRQWKSLLRQFNKHDDISSVKSMDTIIKNHNRNLNETQKKELHNTVVNIYKEVRRQNGYSRQGL